MEKLTTTQLEAMAKYMTSTTHSELREELNEYLTAPKDKKDKLLSELWSKYGDKVTARYNL